MGTAGMTRRLSPGDQDMVCTAGFGAVLAHLRDHYQETIGNRQLAGLAHLSVRAFERQADGCIKGFDRHDGVIQGETNQYYKDFVRAMHETGYQGYFSYELCHQLPVVNGQTVDIEFAHHNAQLAALFMRQLIPSEMV